MWPRTPSLDRQMKTCCPICRSEQGGCHPRAAVTSDLGPSTGYEYKTCPVCRGTGWLPGRLFPV